MTKIAIAIFVIIVALGSLYSVEDYRVSSNLISELGAQQTQNNFMMIIGFLALGTGLIVDGIKHFRREGLPFIMFGVSFALAGIFPHKPIDPSLEFNELWHSIHGALATTAGVFVTIGFIWQGVVNKSLNRKVMCFYLGAVCLVFPLLMLTVPLYQGYVQRLMYLQILLWLWFYFPGKLLSHKTG